MGEADTCRGLHRVISHYINWFLRMFLVNCFCGASKIFILVDGYSRNLQRFGFGCYMEVGGQGQLWLPILVAKVVPINACRDLISDPF